MEQQRALNSDCAVASSNTPSVIQLFLRDPAIEASAEAVERCNFSWPLLSGQVLVRRWEAVPTAWAVMQDGATWSRWHGGEAQPSGR